MERIYRSDEGEREVRAWCTDRLSAWQRPHTTSLVETELGATHVLTAGDGPPLVLIPGTNFAAAVWLGTVDDLATTHRVHAVDLPGQPGLSDGRRQQHASATYGSWLSAVTETMEAARATVVGHSLGALVGMHAVAGGAEVDRLVLVDPAGLRRLSVTPKVLAASIPWLLRSTERSATRILRMMMARGGEPDPELVEWMTLVGRHVRGSLAPPPLDEAAASRLADVPIDVLSGEHDVFLPPAKLRRAVEQRLDAATFEIVPGSGHLLPHERPEALADLVRRPNRPDRSADDGQQQAN